MRVTKKQMADGTDLEYQAINAQPGDGTLPSYQSIGTQHQREPLSYQSTSYGPQESGTVIQTRPPDYMLPSILACMCCFLPTGLFAIYYANKAKHVADAGDYMGARRIANRAFNLVFISVVVGIILINLVVVIRFVVYSGNSRSGN